MYTRHLLAMYSLYIYILIFLYICVFINCTSMYICTVHVHWSRMNQAIYIQYVCLVTVVFLVIYHTNVYLIS